MQSESFGPFSEQIHVADFIDNAVDGAEKGHDVWNLNENPATILPGWSTWSNLANAAQKAIERECE
jgi:hypothetical protein